MILEEVIPKTNTSYLEDKANSILVKNSTLYPHSIDLEKIIDSYKNIRLFYMNQDSKTIIKRDKAIIMVNNNLSIKEQRQELAEELCHVLLHCGNQFTFKNNILLDKQENQAKRMSAYLLCPMFMLKKLTFIDSTSLLIEELSEYFNVTYEFMSYRLNLIFGQDLKLVGSYKGEFYGYVPVE